MFAIAPTILLVSSCVHLSAGDESQLPKADAFVRAAVGSAAKNKGWALVVEKGLAGADRDMCQGEAMRLAEERGATFALTPVVYGANGDFRGALRIWYALTHRMHGVVELKDARFAEKLSDALPTPAEFAAERAKETAKSRVVVQLPDWPLAAEELQRIGKRLADALPAGKARLKVVAVVPFSKESPERIAAPFEADYVVRGWASETEYKLQLYDVARGRGLGEYETFARDAHEETAERAYKTMKLYAEMYLDDR
jgi:hypothetical protein